MSGLLSVTVSKGTNIKKRKKSKKAKNQENGKSKRKRAPSAYILYVKAERKGVADANPGASFGEITRIVAKQWKNLTTAERQKYVDESNAVKSKYAATKENTANVEKVAKKRNKAVRKRKAPTPSPPVPEEAEEEEENDSPIQVTKNTKKATRKRKAPTPSPPVPSSSSSEEEEEEENDSTIQVPKNTTKAKRKLICTEARTHTDEETYTEIDLPAQKQAKLSCNDDNLQTISAPTPEKFSSTDFLAALKEIMAPPEPRLPPVEIADRPAIPPIDTDAQKLLDEAIEKHAVTRKEYEKLLAMKDAEILRLQHENQSLRAKPAVEEPQPAAAPASPKKAVEEPQPAPAPASPKQLSPSKKPNGRVTQSWRITKQLTGCQWVVDPDNAKCIHCTSIYKPTKRAVTFTLESTSDAIDPNNWLDTDNLITYTPTGNQHLLPSYLRKVIQFEANQLPQFYNLILAAMVMQSESS